MTALLGYQLKEKLYESNLSLVYRGQRKQDGRPVILKLLKPPYPPPEMIARFKREYELARSLTSSPGEALSGIVTAYSLENDHHRWIMVLEDFGGESLERLKLARVLPILDFLKLAIEIVDILDRLHRHNIIHKDINPANIVFNPATGPVKIIDFGMAIQLSRENPLFRNPDILEGSLPYISPEQTGRMNRAIDYRTDFYSLGVTFYELLTGQLPFLAADALELVYCHIARLPAPPRTLKPDIPQPLSEIVLKLMAKNAEDRYQSAYGLKADLEACLWQWQAARQIKAFPLGRQDVSDRFQVSQKLYGREREIETLLTAFERVATMGDSKAVSDWARTGKMRGREAWRTEAAIELMLVTGYAGIGKSVLVQEIYKPITGRRGYFISGKFDQFQRDVPYTAFIQAFRALMRHILAESEARVGLWCEKLLTALGPNGQVIIEVIPELALIIGPQPDVPLLGPAEAQNRFNLTFQCFVQLFAQPEHPLVIFLDDLQWADGASLKLIELLLTTWERGCLFLIGAYRDNEVTKVHPLQITLARIEQAGVIVNHLFLLPLDLPNITQLMVDTLHRSPQSAAPLANLALVKTGGNPFFINEFLKSLYLEKLLVFNFQRGSWQWDLGQIQKRGFTDNIITLMAGRVQQLNPESQAILKMAACIGNQFDLETLSLVAEKSFSRTAVDLWENIAEGLILPLSDSYRLITLGIEDISDGIKVEYKFAHDRIRQAVYSLIPEVEQQATHGRIGRLLLQTIPPGQRRERIFDVVNQLNLGIFLIKDQAGRDELAALNLIAGKKAKISAAYEPALGYLRQGIELLSPVIVPLNEGMPVDKAGTVWQRHYNLALELYVEAAEAACLNGNFVEMEHLAERVLQQAATLLDKVKIYEIKIQACLAQHKFREAIQTALPVLRLLGVNFSEKPGRSQILLMLIRTRFNLMGKQVKDLIDLPEMTNPYKLAIIRILSRLHTVVYFAMPELAPLEICTRVNLSIQYGNATLSPFAYADYGLLLCGVLDKIDEGYQFGQLALMLLKKLEAKEVKAKTLLVVNAHIRHWKEAVRDTLPSLVEAYQSGLETGDLEFAVIAAGTYCYTAYFAGEALGQLEQQMGAYIQMLKQLKQETLSHYSAISHQLVLNLLDQPGSFDRLSGHAYVEEEMLPLHLQERDQTGLYLLYNAKMILCYLFERYPQAVEYARLAETYIGGVTGLLLVPLFHFYDSLIRLAAYPDVERSEQRRFLRKVAANQRKLKRWAGHAPMNHLHRFYLVEAERAQVSGKDEAAGAYYRQAVALARENGHAGDEGLMCERAAKFYLAQEKEDMARTFLAEARYAYLRWGALAKVEHMDRIYAYLPVYPLPVSQQAEPLRHNLPTSAILNPSHPDLLDLNTLLKASEIISAETELVTLLEQLIKIALQNSGAQRGVLLLRQPANLMIELMTTASADAIVSSGVAATERPDRLPLSLINYVARIQESVVLEGGPGQEQFSLDPYIAARRPQSILCLPLIHQGQLKAVLYLENDLAAGVFTRDRVEILNLVAAQGAVAIENALRSGRQLLAPPQADLSAGVDLAKGQGDNEAPIQFDPTKILIPETGETLTSREIEILTLIATGATNRAIAAHLVISMPTVKTHVTHLLNKLNVSSRAEAVSRARELAIIPNA